MRYKFPFSAVIICAVIASSGIFVSAQQVDVSSGDPNALKSAIEEKAKKLQEINSKIAETEQNISETKAEGTNLQKDVSKLNYNIQQLNLKIQAGTITVEKLRLELQDLNYNIADIEKSIGKKKEGIVASLRMIQENDNDGLLTILLKSGTLADSVSDAQNLVDLNRGLSLALNDLTSLQNLLNEKVNETAQRKQSLEVETQNTKSRAAIVADQKSERQKLLNMTKAQQKAYEAQLTTLQKQQQSLANEIDDLEAALKKAFNASVLPQRMAGVFSVPIANPRITQRWGELSNLYGGKPHNGVDYGAPYGTEIFAARDGKVTVAGNNGRLQYGKYVLIEHDNGLSTLYAHMSRQAVTTGQVVTRGQVIGYVGATGYAFGNHLHFGLYWSSSINLKNFSGAGPVPVGVTLNPQDYM